MSRSNINAPTKRPPRRAGERLRDWELQVAGALVMLVSVRIAGEAALPIAFGLGTHTVAEDCSNERPLNKQGMECPAACPSCH